MNDPLIQQLVRDRYAELSADAEQHRLARLRPEREPLVRIRFTFELQLGRKQIRA
jgi:hypothetical protein